MSIANIVNIKNFGSVIKIYSSIKYCLEIAVKTFWSRSKYNFLKASEFLVKKIKRVIALLLIYSFYTFVTFATTLKNMNP